MTVDDDSTMLVGLLAMQVGLVDRDGLVAATRSWARDKGRSLADHLQTLGYLAPEARPLVEALAEQHRSLHGGEASRSLAALSLGASTREDLAALHDADVDATLSHVGRGSTEPEGSADRTATHSLGISSADGARFRVLRPHARGGLGAVYVALDEELHREVALKQILDGHADDPVSRQRFLLEAEITGGLEHPGIVPVYGLGHYDGGRPYYAMRFVRGDSLKEAIAAFHKYTALRDDPGRRSLELRKLLRRFLDVCNAVDYAHGRGVLHRDLKPANIIVGRYGETLVVDWGLAKAVGRVEPGGHDDDRPLRPSSASGSAETLPGSAMGTPSYMSPEQAAGDLDRLGPRSDVYSLGATLYCLLTGRPPFAGNNVAEILRDVRAGAFPPPRSLDRSIPAALDAVCRKAMATRPEDRFASPRALADDLERWMADEPVSARRENLRERLARWSRAHRTLVRSAAAALVVALVASGVIAAQQSRAAARERRIADSERRARRAEQQAREAETEALAVARERLGQLEQTNDLLSEIFLDVNPRAAEKEGKTLGTILGERLDRVALELDGRDLGDPELVARLQKALGRSLVDLGYPDKAAEVLRRALRTLEARFGPEHPATFTVRGNLGNALREAGLYEEALVVLQDAYRRFEAKDGPEAPNTLTTRGNLASAYYHLGRFDDAIALHRETVRSNEAKDPNDTETLASRNNLAEMYRAVGRHAEAAEMHRETLRRLEARFSPDHLNTLTARGNLASAYLSSGRLGEAIAMFEASLAGLEKGVGPNHPMTLATRNNLAMCYHFAHRDAEAIPLFRSTLGLLEDRLGPNHPNSVASRANLAACLLAVGGWTEAEPLYRDAIARRRRAGTASGRAMADDLEALGVCLLEQKRPAEAEPILREGLNLIAKMAPNTIARFEAMSRLGDALLGMTDFSGAEPLIVGGYDGLEARRSGMPPEKAGALGAAASRGERLYDAWGKPAEAKAWRVKIGLVDLPADVFARPAPPR